MSGLDRERLGRLARRVAPAVQRELTAQEAASGELPEPARLSLMQRLVQRELDGVARQLLDEGIHLHPGEEEELASRVRSLLVPLGELDRLLQDSSIENIDANRFDEVWITRADGSKERGPALAADEESFVELLRQAAAREGRSERRFDKSKPSVSFRLRDGSRLTAFREVSGDVGFALRRHRKPVTNIDDMYGLGTVGHTLGAWLAAAVRAKFNLVVAGGTDAGKTTLLRALAGEIPAKERLVTVEDPLELGLKSDTDCHPDVVELECREANAEGEGEVTMRDLTKLGLRLNPSRVIVGEVRGPEILDMFQAMSQGNEGSMGSVHARTPESALLKMRSYALQAEEHLTPEAVDALIGDAVEFVIHIHKLRDHRRVVSSVQEIVGFDGHQVVSNDVFIPDERRRAVYKGTAFRAATMDRLMDAGFDPELLEMADGGWVW